MWWRGRKEVVTGGGRRVGVLWLEEVEELCGRRYLLNTW